MAKASKGRSVRDMMGPAMAAGMSGGMDTEDSADMGGDSTDTGEFAGQGETTISLKDYPDLDAKEGAQVEGTFKGEVMKVEGDNATIKYTELNLNSGANRADQSLAAMGGGSGQQ